jgi:hypothetical protein
MLIQILIVLKKPVVKLKKMLVMKIFRKMKI